MLRNNIKCHTFFSFRWSVTILFKLLVHYIISKMLVNPEYFQPHLKQAGVEDPEGTVVLSIILSLRVLGRYSCLIIFPSGEMQPGLQSRLLGCSRRRYCWEHPMNWYALDFRQCVTTMSGRNKHA